MCFTETPHPPGLSSSPPGSANTSEEQLFFFFFLSSPEVILHSNIGLTADRKSMIRLLCDILTDRCTFRADSLKMSPFFQERAAFQSSRLRGYISKVVQTETK